MSFNEHSKILDDLKRFEAALPKMVTNMGKIAQNHFIKSFRDQGFTDQSLERWQPRKGEFGGGIARVRKRISRNAGRAILVKMGNLRRLRRLPMGRESVDIVSNAVTDSYARVHNEGLRSGRGAGFKMPKRQFVGYSRVMSYKIQQMIFREMRGTLKNAA